MPAVAHGVLLDRDPIGHAVVGHGERGLVTHVDLVLRRAGLVMGVLDVDPHLLEREDGLATDVDAGVERGQIEVPALVEGLGDPVLGIGVLEVVELELGADVERLEAHRLGPVECAAQDPARIPLVGVAAGDLDVAEHASGAVLTRAPRQDRERRRVGHGDHVGLLDRVEPRDRRSVEPHSPLERVLELGGVDREALELAEHVGEPEPDEPDAALLDRRDDVLGGLHDLRIRLLLVVHPVSPSGRSNGREPYPAGCTVVRTGV
jgi:hypothetical protein